MASRLTGAAGRGGARPCRGQGVIKGCVFTNTTPRHIKPGRRRPLDPGSAAPTTATCAEPGSTHKAGHHSVLARNTTPLPHPHHRPPPTPPSSTQFGTVNTRGPHHTPPAPPQIRQTLLLPPCTNLKECH